MVLRVLLLVLTLFISHCAQSRHGTINTTQGAPGPQPSVIPEPLPKLSMARILGGTTSDYGDSLPQAIATDSSSRIILGGHVNGTLEMPGCVTTAQVGGFVAKFNGSTCLWYKVAASTGDFTTTGVAIGSNDSVYAVGYFGNTNLNFGDSSVPLNAFSNPNSANIFVVKYSASGVVQWSINAVEITTSRAASVVPTGITYDPSDNSLLVSGVFGGKVDFGRSGTDSQTKEAVGFVDSNNYLTSDIFLAKYDSDGNLVWVKAYGTQLTTPIVRSVASDAIGNILIAGSYNGQLNLNPTDPGSAMTAQGSRNAFIAKVDPSGNTLWSKSFGGVAGQTTEIWSIATDKRVGFGDIVALGNFDGEVMFDAQKVGDAANTYQIWMSKISPNGGLVWIKSFGGGPTSYRDFPKSVFVDGRGYISITGSASNPIDFGGGTLSGLTIGASQAFLAQFRSDGSYRYANRFIGDGSDGLAVTVSNNYQVYTSGFFSASLKIGDTLLENTNDPGFAGTNGYFLKYTDRP